MVIMKDNTVVEIDGRIYIMQDIEQYIAIYYLILKKKKY